MSDKAKAANVGSTTQLAIFAPSDMRIARHNSATMSGYVSHHSLKQEQSIYQDGRRAGVEGQHGRLTGRVAPIGRTAVPLPDLLKPFAVSLVGLIGDGPLCWVAAEPPPPPA